MTASRLRYPGGWSDLDSMDGHARPGGGHRKPQADSDSDDSDAAALLTVHSLLKGWGLKVCAT
jgi:hypothetical protein